MEFESSHQRTLEVNQPYTLSGTMLATPMFDTRNR